MYFLNVEMFWLYAVRRKELEIHVDGKKLKQRQFCLPGWSHMWDWQLGHRNLPKDDSRGNHLEESQRGDRYLINLKERC